MGCHSVARTRHQNRRHGSQPCRTRVSNGHGVAVSVETSSFWAKNSSDTRVRHGACRGRVAVSCNTVYNLSEGVRLKHGDLGKCSCRPHNNKTTTGQFFLPNMPSFSVPVSSAHPGAVLRCNDLQQDMDTLIAEAL